MKKSNSRILGAILGIILSFWVDADAKSHRIREELESRIARSGGSKKRTRFFDVSQIYSNGSKIKFKNRRHEIKRIQKDNSEVLSLELDTPMGTRNLSLIKTQVFSGDVVIRTSSGQSYSGNVGSQIHYQGIDEEYPDESLVSLSFYEDSQGLNRVEGVIEIKDRKIQIGGEQSIVRTDEGEMSEVTSLPSVDTMECSADKVPLPEGLPVGVATGPTTDIPFVQSTSAPVGSINSDSPIKLFFEVDHQLYKDKGSSVTNVLSYLSTIFNRVQSIYANDGIRIEVAEVFVWDTLDPYSSYTTVTQILPVFSGNRGTNHSGHLAHFLTSRSVGGGVAYLTSLCNRIVGHAVSGIYKTIGSLEVYDWSVSVIAHELGHNLGSKHTHWCGWNVNGVANQALDGCFSPEGSCPRGPTPTSGGTIMSYCHLDYTVGIKFANGFGVQPGNTIRNVIQSAACIKPGYKDTTPPFVSISSPSYGKTLYNTTTLSAFTSDSDSQIAKVEFYLSNQLIGTVTKFPFNLSWDTKTRADGTYALRAKAFDTANNSAFSTDTVIVVGNAAYANDVTKPVVSITSPVANSAAVGSVTVNASATDNIDVASVSFYANNTLIAVDTVAPYSASWNTTAYPVGSATLRADAVDVKGNISSTSTTVFVANGVAVPTVTLSSPVDFSTISGTVNLAPVITSSTPIRKVDFFRNSTLIASVTTAPYTFAWNTAGVTDGTYNIVVGATDSYGLVGYSTPKRVTIKNAVSTPPVVTVTAPLPGAVLSGSVSLSASVTSSVSVSKVDFYRGSTLIGTATASPYTLNWNTLSVPNGSYSLNAVATNSNGQAGVSSNVSVSVSNQAVAPLLQLVSLTAGQNKSVTDSTKRNWAIVDVNAEAGLQALTFSAKLSTNTTWSSKTGTSLVKVSNTRYHIYLNSPNTNYDISVGCASCSVKSVQGSLKTLP